jgi:tripartite-type tricarboxylate transporter receptor subunit TctC
MRENGNLIIINKQRLLVMGIILFCLCIFIEKASEAEEYPTQTVRILCGYAPGGSADTQVRLLAPFLQKHLGKSVMIENLTGANAILATNKVFSSPADGYTLLVASIPVLILQEKYLPETARYLTKDLTHIFSFIRDDFVLLSNPEVWKSFAEFSKAAQTKRFRVGIAGKGTPSHMYALLVEEMLKVKFNLIPYEGGGPAMTSLAGKHIDAISTVLSSANHMIKGGTLNPLLILSDRRHPSLPQTPTPKELGFKSFEPIFYITGIFGPPNMPANRVKVLEEAIAKALKEKELLDKARDMTLEIYPLNSREFLNVTENQYPLVDKYIKIFKSTAASN